MMDFKEQAKRKHETYAKSTETSDLMHTDVGSLVFYTKDANGFVRMHTYFAEGRTIELVEEFPTVVKTHDPDTVVEEKKATSPKKNEGIVARAVRKLKGE